MSLYSLPLLPTGKVGTIEYIDASSISTRLSDLGFTHGASIRRLFSAPSGNPKAYFIRGTVIALRDQDAEKIKASI